MKQDDSEITLLDILGCEYPVIQGAMGVICNPELVAAVSEAGGFGLLATAFLQDPSIVRDQVVRVKKLTQKPFGANLHVMNPMAREFGEILADQGVKCVTVSGGNPKDLIPVLHDREMKVIAVVPSVLVALKSRDLGVDAIIAEGAESGGMQGFKGASTMVLTPAVVDAVDLPVASAGGIADYRGFRAALALGAQGVQVGTRFIASMECIAHANYKTAIMDADESSTDLVNLGAFRVRVLKTSLAMELMQKGPAGLDGFSGIGLEQAWVKGDLDSGILPAGQVAGLIRETPTVRKIIEDMVRDWPDISL